MKKMMVVASCMLGAFLLNAQQYTIDDVNQSVFLYPNFYLGKVLFKDKTTQPAIFNYNTLFQQMMYVQDGTMLALDKTSSIDTVYIDSVAFIPVDSFFYEVRLPHTSLPLFIKYETEVSEQGQATPFGGTSQTGAVQNVASYRFNAATPYQLKVPDAYNVRKSVIFYLKPGNQFIQIKGLKQIRQLYPAIEKQINQFIRDNHISFDKKDDMEKLVSFIGTTNK